MLVTLRLDDGSRAGVCTEEKPRCVHGHYVQSDSVFPTHGVVTCRYRPVRGGPRCNTALHLSLLHAGGSALVKGAGERFWFVVELKGERLRHLKQIPMTVLETLVFLGLALPGTYDDLVTQARR